MADTDRPWEPPLAGSETEHLLGALDRLRATFRWKADDLDAAGLRTRIGASSLTLGGLLKHLAPADGGLHQLVRVSAPDGQHACLRRIVCDMIEEYGRHTGHADLLREAVDGRVGEDPPAGWCAH